MAYEDELVDQLPSRDARRRAIRGSLIAFGLAIAAGTFLAVWPCFYVGQGVTSAGGATEQTHTCATLFAENGLWVVWLLLVPMVLAAAGWLGAVADRRMVLWVAGSIALAFCLLSAFSIGVFYLPAAIALLVTAAIRGRRERDA